MHGIAASSAAAALTPDIAFAASRNRVVDSIHQQEDSESGCIEIIGISKCNSCKRKTILSIKHHLSCLWLKLKFHPFSASILQQRAAALPRKGFVGSHCKFPHKSTTVSSISSEEGGGGGGGGLESTETELLLSGTRQQQQGTRRNTASFRSTSKYRGGRKSSTVDDYIRERDKRKK